MKKILSLMLVALILSIGIFAADSVTDAELPNAEVINLGAIRLTEYRIYNGSLVEGTDPIELQIAMQFLAKDTPEQAAANAYGNYTTDFYITLLGMAGDSITMDADCYLAGHYGDFGWIMIPLENLEVGNGVVNPVITTVGFDFKYTDICTSVKDFKCGIHLSDAVLTANPDLKVQLELGLSEDLDAAQNATFIPVEEPYTYTAEELSANVTYVAKTNGVYYTDLQAAINAAGEGGTVELLAPLKINAGETVTIDLKGATVVYTSDVAGDSMITNKGDLTIEDSVGDGAIVFTYNGEPDSSYSKGNYTITNAGTLTVNGGTVKNATAAMSHMTSAIDNNSTTGNAVLVIEDGSVINENYIAIRQFANSATYENTVTVNDGEVIGGKRAIWMHLPSSNSATVQKANLTVNGGTLTSNDETYNLAIYVYSYGASAEKATVTVTGGTVNGNIAINETATATMAEGAATVTGGTITGEYGIFSYAEDAVAVPVISITGGTFETDYSEFYAADENYTFTANADGTYGVAAVPQATVSVLEPTTLTEYRIYTGGTKEEDLITGTEPLDLEVVMKFEAQDTLEEALAGGFSKWLVDFNVTVTGLENGSVTLTDDSYLAGNYGSYGWIVIPLDEQTIENGVAYPVVANYDPTLNYKDICKSVKSFMAAIHVDQAILDANPDMKVTLELKMTNPDNANDVLVIGEPAVYDVEDLANKKDLFAFAGTNMILKSAFAMNFYVNKSDIVGEDYYAVMTKENADGEATVVTVDFADWTNYNSALYRFSYTNIAACEMADDIAVVVYDGNDNAVSVTKVESVRSYAMRTFVTNEEFRSILVDMLNYGAAAQNYFGYNTGDLANNELTAEHLAYATPYAGCTDNRVKGDNFVGSSLVLRDRIELKFYFNNIDTSMYAIYSYTDNYNTKSARVEGSEFFANGSMYGINADTMPPAACRQLVTCTVYTADGVEVATAQDSVESYVARIQNSADMDVIFEKIMSFSDSLYAHYGLAE